MSLVHRNVTIIGAGIAGLSVALAMARFGANVTVLEQAPAIREVGAGIQISPNGMHVIAALGLAPDLRDRSHAATAVQLRDAAGRNVARINLSDADYNLIHRAALIDLLAEGARNAGVRIELGRKVRAIDLSDRPRVTFDTGAPHEADLLLGADGLHSRLRAVLNGEATPRFTGHIAWRSVIMTDHPEPPEATVHMGPGRHLVSYPLIGRRHNIVGVLKTRHWAEEGWSIPDDPAHFRAAFRDFSPHVQAMLDRVETVHLWGLFRHPVATHWHAKGRAAILGDAAHPTLPFLAQGANLALEDAWVLAQSLNVDSDTTRALATYQTRRRTRAARVVAAAARNAWKYHLRFPPLRWAAHQTMRTISNVAPGMLLGQFDWLYGEDVTAADAV